MTLETYRYAGKYGWRLLGSDGPRQPAVFVTPEDAAAHAAQFADELAAAVAPPTSGYLGGYAP